ncbi:hypothetical protein COCC4DRAFT_183193 [Bipolaris maydis ATCC 48331]|uniref:Peroxisomal ATPase PEX1 n=2 Tax=Cochliobolus heterostrophus TaxID=5016 RepID=M2V6G0_COCH5|nr:uncharacterized protein COCC4DRAFT_183193 [Bipolaris maydis ATCC 48331]EMD95612.1 hypothetical protein COCHEDRAFT_1126495 [Bipolaris maydis C5]KAH7561549.1 hypothetical protein BM1_02653 [Bipolaris maydis]ENI10473.1 hypothetical protein COCC4DRAFT_183193 [Bipolaris maydis ATCC 48331]KAJ5030356.1 P-loop containing nucleoside triphosphate hydrolase protein [Bipolaris maydis]KAJ5065363.1 ribosome biogenesis ATPase RIX7 [Bipolaris maydis]
MAPTGRPTLEDRLEAEVRKVVEKYLSDKGISPSELRTSIIYQYIQRQNSNLKRRSKRQLEDLIDRAIDAIQEDESRDDEEDNVELRGNSIMEEARDVSGDFMNRQIVAGWTTSLATSNDKSSKREGERPKDDRDSKRQKRTSTRESSIRIAGPTDVSLQDLGGVDDVKEQLKDHLVLPLLDPQEYTSRKIPIPRGILLHGPPGCGKTLISKAFAAELGVPFVEILGPSIVSGISGESEKQIREHFDRAREVAPCLLFIDEIDVIAPKRDNAQSQMDKRIVAQLLISMDSLAMEGNDGKPVIVLAATNRPDDLDPALRRGGRFDTEINMGVPSESVRKSILTALTRETKLSPDVDLHFLAKRTAGFVGADLKDLVSKAGTFSMAQYRRALEQQTSAMEGIMDIDNNVPQSEEATVNRSIRLLIQRVKDKEAPRPEGFEHPFIDMAAFKAVLPSITPSSRREGFATVPDITWSDVGALEGIREELKMAICAPIEDPERFARVGITAPAGVLLWGPPGCGKTLIAKAAAAESKANFISVRGPELTNKYLGESERAIRQLFERARSSVPCIIFFDEFDAITPKRSTELHEASARVVNTLLTELDGLAARDGIYLIAATNRPEMIDQALLRPGRLETLLYVPPPQPSERVNILRSLIRKRGVINPDLAEIGSRDMCNNFSGADLESLLRRAGQHAFKRGAECVEELDMIEAAKLVQPSVRDIERYERLRETFEKPL